MFLVYVINKKIDSFLIRCSIFENASIIVNYMSQKFMTNDSRHYNFTLEWIVKAKIPTIYLSSHGLTHIATIFAQWENKKHKNSFISITFNSLIIINILKLWLVIKERRQTSTTSRQPCVFPNWKTLYLQILIPPHVVFFVVTYGLLSNCLMQDREENKRRQRKTLKSLIKVMGRVQLRSEGAAQQSCGSFHRNINELCLSSSYYEWFRLT